MEKSEFKQVRGELTETIVDDLKTNLEKCLQVISFEQCFENGITEAELYFIINKKHLDFFNPEQARKMTNYYNFLELAKASYEQFGGLVEKLLIPKEFDQNSDNQSRLVIASRYFLTKINGIIMNKNYTPKVESHDEIYLKFLQAMHEKYDCLAIEKMQSYNTLQGEIRQKCRSKAKLKQIIRIENKVGYTICLE